MHTEHDLGDKIEKHILVKHNEIMKKMVYLTYILRQKKALQSTIHIFLNFRFDYVHRAQNKQ
jgi:hypothetical protein